MEDLLELYALPSDPLRPVVCLDETSVGLAEDVREPLPARPGTPRREDAEHAPKGGVSVFAALVPKEGKRLLWAGPTRTARDFAHFARRVVDELCAGAERVRLVLDNLNTHVEGSLYKAFPPEEARRLARKLEFHYTPRHGSWLNPVELEFAALKKQCLDRRLGTLEEVMEQIQAWQRERNEKRARVRWTFDLTAAREKLARIYPQEIDE
jgi:transposase